MVASSVHVGSRFRLWGCCIVLIKPCHMLSTGYSRDPMSWNGKSGHSQIPCNWLILPFQPCFTLVPLCPIMHFQPNLYFFLYILCLSASLLLSKLFFPCALSFLACQYPFSPLYRAANYFSFKSKQKVCISHSLIWSLSGSGLSFFGSPIALFYVISWWFTYLSISPLNLEIPYR